MTALAAIQGDFVDLRFVKGRKVCQIIIEAPIEAGGAIVSAFGTPNPAITIPVVLARLNSPYEAKETPIAEAKQADPHRLTKGGKLSREAAMLCQAGAFWKFMEEHVIGTPRNSDEAADLLRSECGVTSRAELDHDEKAAARFREIKSSYDAWMIAA
jgi:hypothetical protein